VGQSEELAEASHPRKTRTKNDEIMVVEFSPWQIRGVDELTLQFFAQVHAHLGAGIKVTPPEGATFASRVSSVLCRSDWDKQMASEGKFDRVMEEAEREYRAGQCREWPRA
jgi:hypothetical protein